MKNIKKVMSLILVFVLLLSMTLITGCSKKETSKLIVTVNDKKVYLDETMYYIYAVESQGNYYDQMYQSYFGTSYWETEYEEGVTIRQMLKDYVMDTVVMNEILYEKALAEKITLTDEEKATNETTVTEMLASLSESQIKQTGFTKESLMAMQEKTTIVYKYQDSLVEAFDIDDAAITASIKAEDLRQYNTEYMLFPTSTTDAEGKAVALSTEEKAAALVLAEEVLAKVKAGETFETLKETYTTAKADVLNFVKGDETADAAYTEAAMKLENDAYSDVIETETGYYVMKMLDNNSTESYDTAVKEAISAEESAKFTEAYEAMKKDYKITINTEVWDTIVMGETIKVEEAPADTTATVAPTEETPTEETTTEAPAAEETTTPAN